MTTPRSESIGMAYSSDDLLIVPPAESLDRNKVGHYAALARVMKESFERYVADNRNVARLHECTSPANLRRTLAYTLTDHAHAVIHSDEFTVVHDALQESQDGRALLNPYIWRRIEDNLEAGAHTFVNTTEAIYNILEAEISPAVARSPASASLLDRLAKLNISQFIPYRNVYLETHSQRRHFLAQLEPHDGGRRFQKGYPLKAFVPSIIESSQDFRTESYALDGDFPLVMLADIAPERATIGCPITFYKGQVQELWDIYTSARVSLGRRAGVGSVALNFGDTAASREATT